MTTEIKDNLPIPPRRGGKRVYPWDDLKEVGQHFEWSLDDTPGGVTYDQMCGQVQQAASRAAARRQGVKYRTAKDDAEQIIRVWRTA